MAPQAFLCKGNAGERSCLSTRAAGHVERIICDLPLFSRVWDGSGDSGPCEDVFVLLSPPPATLFECV